MPDYDDEVPEPQPETPRGGDAPRRRRGRFGRRGGGAPVPDHEGSTGEVEVGREPMIEDFGFEDFEDAPASEAPPRPRPSGGSTSSGSGGGRSSSSSRGRSGGRGRGGGSRGRSGPPRRGRSGRSGGGSLLQQPAMRLLLGLVLAAILILVIVLVVRDCQRNNLVDSYEEYMNEVATLTSDSSAQGERLRTILNNDNDQTPQQVAQQVKALGGEAQQLADTAEGLDPPGKLNAANRSLVTTLQYRVTGLNTLAEAIPVAVESNDGNFAGTTLAAPMQRLLSSDVIYDDSFVGPAQQALADDDITGIEVPEPEPFLANAAWASTPGARTLLPRIKGQGDGGSDTAPNDGQLRGTQLIKTEALPSGQQLAAGQNTTVQASEQLKWRVTVENGGDVTLEGVVVKATFTYPDSPTEPQEVEAAIESIEPGQQSSIELPGPTDLSFGDPATLRIDVQPVAGEGNTDNNIAEYPVTITI